MKTLTAHFDGKKIVLDEPFSMKPDTKLIVTVMDQAFDNEREAWLHESQKRFDSAYGENEPEYSVELIKEINPDYDGK
ncbi:MAG: hypothetical protein HQK84_03300 [Nitrospinae bacterium]|nr:hypothetical protein [Nitrospinota bacterium]